jgi:hypothetical protein
MPTADAETCRRVWMRLLRQLPPDQRAVLFHEAPAPEDLRGWFHLSDVLAGLHRTVGAAGLRFGDVADRCRALYDDSGRWLVLARLQREYARELERPGAVDGSWRGCRRCPPAPSSVIETSGSSAWARCARTRPLRGRRAH